MDLFELIDRVPEFPYFILAFFYLFQESEPIKAVHVFSSSFIFLSLTLLTGAILKQAFKTKRPKNRWNVPVFRYGFPSIHTMISVGALAFLVFVEPFYSILLIPAGFLYPYSRIKLKLHTKEDVTGGAFIGAFLGYLSGIFILPFYFPFLIESIFAALMFILPILFSFARSRVLKS